MGEREAVVTIHRSAGNESVGEMWTETKVFKPESTVTDILNWVDEQTNESTHRTSESKLNISAFRKR